MPAALSTYPHDIEKHPRPWAEERFRHIVRCRAPEACGYFPALEMPGELVRRLRKGLAAVLAASAGTVLRPATPLIARRHDIP